MATKDEVSAFIAKAFPHSKLVIDSVGDCGSTVSLAVEQRDLRPGGTVSGPTLMAIADSALYAAVLGEIGIVPMAVTTSMTINFLRKPEANRRVIGVCKLFKVGKTLATGEVSLYSDGKSEPVAHVVGTYAIPAGRVK